jgi:hypothetical protein
MDITFTGIFSGFSVPIFLYTPIGVKQGVDARKQVTAEKPRLF